MPNPDRFPVPDTFESERLVLRSFQPEFAQVLHEALVESLPELRRHLWFLPWVAEEQTPESALIRCRTAQAKFLLRTDLPYLAFEKKSGRLVASAGLHRVDWDLPKTEVGYWVRSSEVGRGFATESVRLLTSWAFEILGAVRVQLVTDEQNAGSRAVAERCGFQLEGIQRNMMRAPDGELRHSCIYARLAGG